MTWKEYIEEESKKEYYINLKSFLEQERLSKNILPKEELVFDALSLTELKDVKVVIIGQDPYPNKEYPMGLAFSVNDGVKLPMSLKNIYKELQIEFGYDIPTNGNLTCLAKKGVLLLNTILTVEEGKPLSHKNKGWEIFTLGMIKEIEKENRKIVYILLGNEALKIKDLITNPMHIALTASHPSPLSARHSFFYSDIFKKASLYLDLDKDFWRIENEN